MDLDELEAELGLLLTEMEGDPGDLHEIYMRLKQLLDQMRAYGMEMPEDLLRMEKEMSEEFEKNVPPGLE